MSIRTEDPDGIPVHECSPVLFRLKFPTIILRAVQRRTTITWAVNVYTEIIALHRVTVT